MNSKETSTRLGFWGDLAQERVRVKGGLVKHKCYTVNCYIKIQGQGLGRGRNGGGPEGHRVTKLR
jgi:hypothetical protein